MWAPVCGCDGATYGNDCEAASAGVNVLYEGECEVEPEVECKTNNDCESGEYCDKFSCDDDQGYCEKMGEICDTKLDQVCGCDDITYGNDCERARAGISLRLYRACPVCDSPCEEGICCPGCQNTSFCSTNDLGCPMMKCAP